MDNFGCVSNVEVYGLRESVRASKYPMSTDVEETTPIITDTVKKLAQSEIGSGHDNFLNGIIVQFDLTFTVKAWTEAERYHFFDFVSSQSTMHRITKFDLDKAYIDYVDPRMIEIMKELVDRYNQTESPTDYLRVLYSNPTGFRLTARMTTNYRQLKTIYSQRRTHRLPEWREFCKWVETLPYSDFITGKNRARVISREELFSIQPGTVLWYDRCRYPEDDSLMPLQIVAVEGVSTQKYRNDEETVIVYLDGFDLVREYRHSYRFWTQRPLDEQRKNEKWLEREDEVR